MPTVRLERSGKFGPVGVVDTASARRFTIGGVLQGASLLRPPANSVPGVAARGPGPVIETRYQLAWLLAGQRHPSGRGVMLGLGGGCGAVGLLHEFPGLSLDAVEADPAMSAMAREFHPLVAHYERAGRLCIHIADATAYLSRANCGYDFALADVTVNADSLPIAGSEALVRAVVRAAPEAWLRVFGSFPDGEVHPILDSFATAGRPVDWLLSPVSPTVPIPRPRDWVLASGVSELPMPGGHVPFARMGPAIDPIRMAYRKLIRTALPGPQSRGAGG